MKADAIRDEPISSPGVGIDSIRNQFLQEIAAQLSEINEKLPAPESLHVSVVRAALNLLQKDAHHWSTRPCETCRTITGLVNQEFGCLLYKRQREGKDAAI